MSAVRGLVRGRLFYILLAIVTPPAYIWAARYHLATGMEPTPPGPMSDMLSGTLDLAVLQSAIWRHKGIAVASLISTLLLVSMLILGAFIGVRTVTRGRWRTLMNFPCALPSSWTLRELWRILVLIAAMIMWLPVVHAAMTVHFPDIQISLGRWLLGTTLFMDSFVIIIVMAFAAEKAATSGKLFGLWPQNPREAFRVSCRAYLGLFPWNFVALFAVADIAHRLGYEPPVLPIQRLLFSENRPDLRILLVFLACVMGPIAEEIFFRGVVYASLRRHVPTLAAMLASGVLFALVHGNWIGLLPITLLGGLLAYLYERTGSLLCPIAVHIFHNSFLLWKGMLLRELMQLK